MDEAAALLVQSEIREPREQRLKHDATLPARQLGAGAEVDAVTEARVVANIRAVHVEGFRDREAPSDRGSRSPTSEQPSFPWSSWAPQPPA
jgi:hypothetical protein